MCPRVEFQGAKFSNRKGRVTFIKESPKFPQIWAPSGRGRGAGLRVLMRGKSPCPPFGHVCVILLDGDLKLLKYQIQQNYSVQNKI